MRIVVTGAAGFVGGNLARAWAAAGHEVIAVVHPSSDTWRLAGAACAPGLLDLEQPDTIATFLDDARPDVVVSAAAHGAYSYQHDIDRMAAVNLLAVERLARWCTANRVPLLHLGSSSEYGTVDHAPAETERLAPNSAYAITKAAGSHAVCDAVAREGLQGVVLRLYSVYGPWEEPGRLMPTVARWALDGLLPPTLVDPDVARDFVHVDDVVRAATTWISDPVAVGEPAIVNIGSGDQTTLGQLVALVRAACEIRAEPAWGTMPRRGWDTSCWVADARRAGEVLGWSAGTDLGAGIVALTNWVAAHLARYPKA